MSLPIYDTSNSAANAVASGSLTIALTIASGSNRGLVVLFTTADAVTISSAVWNTSENLTFLNALADTANTGKHWIYGLIAPSPGSFNIVITFGTTTRNIGGGISFTVCDQATLLANFASGTGNTADPTLSVTSNTDAMVVSSACTGGVATTLTVDAPATQRWNGTDGSGQLSGGSHSDGQASATTMNWTLDGTDQWAMVGCCVRGLSVPASKFIPPLSMRPGMFKPGNAR